LENEHGRFHGRKVDREGRRKKSEEGIKNKKAKRGRKIRKTDVQIGCLGINFPFVI
jgi:hypothetical protein